MKNNLTAAALSLILILSVAPGYAAADEGDAAAAFVPVAPVRMTKTASRPALLPALYASYAALQAYDVYSTKQALALGAREANPLMQGVVGNTGAMMVVKASAVAGAIVASERLWKTNKPAAIAVMIASNGVAAIVAARNARTLKGLH